MSEKVQLKILRCPTCGASLKAETQTDSLTCLFCGNTIVPVEETAAPREDLAGFSGTLKVEGIKTPSSALAYIEEFFEDYDWDAFTFAQSLSVEEIDTLANSLKTTSADDKSTWLVCFQAAAVPFIHKVNGWHKILDSVIEEYKQDSLDAYSKFDAYKRIAVLVTSNRDKIVANLEKIAAKAEKYGATSQEIATLQTDIQQIRGVALGAVYNTVEEIPQVSAFIAEKNAKIAASLAAKGINAEAAYKQAQVLVSEQRYVTALNLLRTLEGYADTEDIMETLDRYFLIGDVLEVCGKLYYFKTSTANETLLELYPSVDGKISDKAIITDIKRIITNYADTLYYLNSHNELVQYDLSLDLDTVISKEAFDTKTFYRYGRKVFLLAKQEAENYDHTLHVMELDLTNSQISPLIEDVQKILALTEDKLVYNVNVAANGKDEEATSQVETRILNVQTMVSVSLGFDELTIEGYLGNYLVYTQENPNSYNKALYIRALEPDAKATLVEQNIYSFCDILGGKLFYYVGNSKSRTLIHCNPDGTQRKEWPRHITEVLFEQGGWLYFIRRSGYNSVLCRSRLDGSKYRIIAADIENFVEIKNGYLYYVNDDSVLVKVRMDGSNYQVLCQDVDTVLSVQENKIIFVSADDRITQGQEGEYQTTKAVKSIYAVEFNGSGKRKLAYNIKNAQEYDDNTVYYLASEKVEDSQPVQYLDALYKLDVDTNQLTKLMDLETVKSEEPSLDNFMVAVIIACIAVFIGLICIATGAAGFGLFCMLIGIATTLIAVAMKNKGKE